MCCRREARGCRPGAFRLAAALCRGFVAWRWEVSRGTSFGCGFRSAVGSAAVRAGSCGFVSWRVSLHAASGRVAVASFAEHAVAAAFARSWAGQLGQSVAVRPGPVIGGRVRSWRVSVPVAVWPSASAGQLLVRGGGVVGAWVCRGVGRGARRPGFAPRV